MEGLGDFTPRVVQAEAVLPSATAQFLEFLLNPSLFLSYVSCATDQSERPNDEPVPPIALCSVLCSHLVRASSRGLPNRARELARMVRDVVVGRGVGLAEVECMDHQGQCVVAWCARAATDEHDNNNTTTNNTTNNNIINSRELEAGGLARAVAPVAVGRVLWARWVLRAQRRVGSFGSLRNELTPQLSAEVVGLVAGQGGAEKASQSSTEDANEDDLKARIDAELALLRSITRPAVAGEAAAPLTMAVQAQLHLEVGEALFHRGLYTEALDHYQRAAEWLEAGRGAGAAGGAPWAASASEMPPADPWRRHASGCTPQLLDKATRAVQAALARAGGGRDAGQSGWSAAKAAEVARVFGDAEGTSMVLAGCEPGLSSRLAAALLVLERVDRAAGTAEINAHLITAAAYNWQANPEGLEVLKLLSRSRSRSGLASLLELIAAETSVAPRAAPAAPPSGGSLLFAGHGALAKLASAPAAGDSPVGAKAEVWYRLHGRVPFPSLVDAEGASDSALAMDLAELAAVAARGRGAQLAASESAVCAELVRPLDKLLQGIHAHGLLYWRHVVRSVSDLDLLADVAMLLFLLFPRGWSQREGLFSSKEAAHPFRFRNVTVMPMSRFKDLLPMAMANAGVVQAVHGRVSPVLFQREDKDKDAEAAAPPAVAAMPTQVRLKPAPRPVWADLLEGAFVELIERIYALPGKPHMTLPIGDEAGDRARCCALAYVDLLIRREDYRAAVRVCLETQLQDLLRGEVAKKRVLRPLIHCLQQLGGPMIIPAVVLSQWSGENSLTHVEVAQAILKMDPQAHDARYYRFLFDMTLLESLLAIHAPRPEHVVKLTEIIGKPYLNEHNQESFRDQSMALFTGCLMQLWAEIE
jgi:hypothetical protein